MTGARRPAVAATLVNLAWKGNPEGLPRGNGATPRDAIPPYRCARADSASAGRVRSWRRVIGRITTPAGAGIRTAGAGRAIPRVLPRRPCRFAQRDSESTDRPARDAEPAG